MLRSKIYFTAVAACGALIALALSAAELSPPEPPNHAGPSGLGWHHLSPVEFFRGLLGMTPAERERALAKRSETDRAVILAKLQEYEAMPKGIREARLCQTELHWELTTLMKLPPAQQSNRLEEVSVLYRPMVANLLQEWDKVPSATQKALLEKANFIGTYLRMQGGTEAAQKEILDKLPPDRRARWAEEMGRWQALPEEQRSELCAEFQHFFALSGQQQKETIDTLSADERKEMKNALLLFDKLPVEQRSQCINSFRKFATMAPNDREQFLKNAARWDAMTRNERQLWRELVHRLPPAPPGFSPDMPPMPPRMQLDGPTMPPMPPNVTTPVIIARSTNDDAR